MHRCIDHFCMQAAAPQLVDISQETAATRRLYGLDAPDTREFGTRCLLARRMIENGVRFVQLYSGNTVGWDAHENVLKNHSHYCTQLYCAVQFSNAHKTGVKFNTPRTNRCQI